MCERELLCLERKEEKEEREGERKRDTRECNKQVVDQTAMHLTG